MLREAAYLGVPAYSLFQGSPGGVDRHLEAIGRLVLLTPPPTSSESASRNAGLGLPSPEPDDGETR